MSVGSHQRISSIFILQEKKKLKLKFLEHKVMVTKAEAHSQYLTRVAVQSVVNAECGKPPEYRLNLFPRRRS